jgi:pimeloyl-ACP methyl ester carboxylesterase
MSKPTGTSTLAQVNGIELGYQDLGSGSRLVLLHGGFGSVEMFGPMLSDDVIPFLDGDQNL